MPFALVTRQFPRIVCRYRDAGHVRAVVNQSTAALRAALDKDGLLPSMLAYLRVTWAFSRTHVHPGRAESPLTPLQPVDVAYTMPLLDQDSIPTADDVVRAELAQLHEQGLLRVAVRAL